MIFAAHHLASLTHGKVPEGTMRTISTGARVAGRYAQTTGRLAGCDKLYRR
jgi:hypothetical protein